MNKLTTYREKIKGIIYNRQLSSVMNNTKWSELQKAIDRLPFPPPYMIKYIDEESEPAHMLFNEDVWYLGDWTDEPLLPFFRIEWIKVRPRYLIHEGRLVPSRVVDETADFLAILKECSIPYEADNEAFLIYGYK